MKKINQFSESFFLSQLKETFCDAIYCKDKGGRLSFVNDAFRKGMPGRKVIGKTDAQLYGKRNVRKILKDDEGVLRGNPLIDQRETITLPAKNGQGPRKISVSTTKLPITRNNEVVGLVGITRDISDQANLEAMVWEHFSNALIFSLSVDGEWERRNDPVASKLFGGPTEGQMKMLGKKLFSQLKGHDELNAKRKIENHSPFFLESIDGHKIPAFLSAEVRGMGTDDFRGYHGIIIVKKNQIEFTDMLKAAKSQLLTTVTQALRSLSVSSVQEDADFNARFRKLETRTQRVFYMTSIGYSEDKIIDSLSGVERRRLSKRAIQRCRERIYKEFLDQEDADSLKVKEVPSASKVENIPHSPKRLQQFAEKIRPLVDQYSLIN